MRRRFVTVIMFAVLAAFAASTVVYRSIMGRAQAKPLSSTVLVAARDLAVGTLVVDDDLNTVAWPGTVTEGWVRRREDVVGRGVISLVNKGEPFSENRLAPKGAGAGLAATIPAGMRAVAVKVDEVVGVSGFVLPGMRVDVVSSGTPPGSPGVVTRTILQNIEVLSAGRNTDRDVQGKPATVQVQVVNLLVSPEQAEALSLAGAQTRIQLVLRNVLDTVSNRTPGISMNQLLLGTAADARPATASRPKVRRPDPPRAMPVTAALPPVTPPAKVELPTIEIINGQKREQVAIRDTGEPEQKQ